MEVSQGIIRPDLYHGLELLESFSVPRQIHQNVSGGELKVRSGGEQPFSGAVQFEQGFIEGPEVGQHYPGLEGRIVPVGRERCRDFTFGNSFIHQISAACVFTNLPKQ